MIAEMIEPVQRNCLHANAHLPDPRFRHRQIVGDADHVARAVLVKNGGLHQGMRH